MDSTRWTIYAQPTQTYMKRHHCRMASPSKRRLLISSSSNAAPNHPNQPSHEHLRSPQVAAIGCSVGARARCLLARQCLTARQPTAHLPLACGHLLRAGYGYDLLHPNLCFMSTLGDPSAFLMIDLVYFRILTSPFVVGISE